MQGEYFRKNSLIYLYVAAALVVVVSICCVEMENGPRQRMLSPIELASAFDVGSTTVGEITFIPTSKQFQDRLRPTSKSEQLITLNYAKQNQKTSSALDVMHVSINVLPFADVDKRGAASDGGFDSQRGVCWPSSSGFEVSRSIQLEKLDVPVCPFFEEYDDQPIGFGVSPSHPALFVAGYLVPDPHRTFLVEVAVYAHSTTEINSYSNSVEWAEAMNSLQKVATAFLSRVLLNLPQ